MIRPIRKTKLKLLFLFSIVIITILLAIYQSFIKTPHKNLFIEPFGLINTDSQSLNFQKNLFFISSTSSSLTPSSSPPSSFSFSSLSLQSNAQCSFLTRPSNLSLDTVYDFPNFVFNPFATGFWNDKIEQRYFNKLKKKKFPLKLILMLHSHTDPGWLKTFEAYYLSSVVNILNNLVQELTIHPNLTFIWPEISFLDRWWKSLEDKPEIKNAFIKLIHNGQLELVSGGWVMTDEAVSYYYSMIDQLIEGHQWIRTNLKINNPPKNSWSCDPFGHSGTFPYFLQKSGVQNMVIQRIHFAWKEKLAMQENLEFWWSQVFLKTLDFNFKNSIFCHVMPFEIYNFKHGCGPSTKVCLQFDFRKIPDEYSESISTPINDKNLEEKAHILLGQYSRTASLFPHNVALIPLGDDFRYNSKIEWDQQRVNFELLMNYINTNEAKFNNTKIQFGTLKDYFDEVKTRSKYLKQFPSLIGDFFPYADVYGGGLPSYWTGYYTSHPFWKQLGRNLEHYLRSAEILYTLAYADAHQNNKNITLIKLKNDYQYLTLARQSLGLFQHHDAVTGTSKMVVMQDYGKRMHRSIIDLLRIMSHTVQYFLSFLQTQSYNSKISLYPILQLQNFDQHFDIVSLKLSPFIKYRKLFVFNSHLQSVELPIRFRISKPFFKIKDSQTGLSYPFQIVPVWSSYSKINEEKYEVVFIPKLPPLSLTTFDIYISNHGVINKSQSSISFFLSYFIQNQKLHNNFHYLEQNIFKINFPPHQDFELNSPFITAIFDHSSGLLKMIRDKKTQKEHKVNLNFYYYESRNGLSGAYLFQTLNSEPIQVVDHYPTFKLIEGPIFTELIVSYLNILEIVFRVYQTQNPIGASIYIEPRLNLSKKENYNNKEIIMRLESDIKNFDEKYSSQIFYTDSNGFQTVPRLYNPNFGVYANYYPMTSHLYIEDAQNRLTLFSSCSHGSSSTILGSMEVMLDRRLKYDDSRGVSEAMLHNLSIRPKFLLLLENLVNPHSSYAVPSLSSLANYLSLTFLYPPIIFSNNDFEEKAYKSHRYFVKHSIACSIHLVNLRTLPLAEHYESPSVSSLLILHNRTNFCSVKPWSVSFCEERKYNSIEFKKIKPNLIEETSLTGLTKLKSLHNLSEIKIMPMELASFNLTF